MILKGKYWLNLNNSYSSSLSGISVNARFTTKWLDTGVEEAFTQLQLVQESGGVIRATGISEVAVGISVELGYYVLGTSGSGYYGYSRILDFGEAEQEVSSGNDTAFTAFLMPLPDDEFVSESNLVQVTNKLLDEIYTETLSKIESLRPTLTSNLVTSSSGVSSVAKALNNYDIVFLRANAYSSYTPLCYAIPAKAICSAGIASIPFKVADNAQNTMFKIASANSPSYSVSRTSGSGLIFQMYGLTFPTLTTGVN